MICVLLSEASGPHPWYLDPVFLPAATGLFGVLIGAMIAAVSSYLLDERRDERERQREELNRRTESKRAARLIDLDLSNAAARAHATKKGGTYWPPHDVPLTFPGWEEYKAVIATALSEESWGTVRMGIEAIKNLNTYREMDSEGPADDKFMPAVSKEFKDGIPIALDQLEEARAALAPFLR
jgi:hypothetical protein